MKDEEAELWQIIKDSETINSHYLEMLVNIDAEFQTIPANQLGKMTMMAARLRKFLREILGEDE